VPLKLIRHSRSGCGPEFGVRAAPRRSALPLHSVHAFLSPRGNAGRAVLKVGQFRRNGRQTTRADLSPPDGAINNVPRFKPDELAEFNSAWMRSDIAWTRPNFLAALSAAEAF
jgi:hypothetical protein